MSTPLNESEIRIIVARAVRDTLTSLGVDLDDAKGVRELQLDFAYMRQQRLGAAQIAMWVKKSAITAAVTGALFALWQGFRFAVSAKLGGP